MCYLDLRGGCKQSVVWIFKTLLFQLLSLWANEQIEMSGEVATQKRLVGGDVQQQSHGLYVEPRL